MSKYKRYDKYKDSGVEWLGKIPGHWEVAGFKKYLATIVDYRGKTPEKKEEGIFLVTARNIKKGKLDYTCSQEYISKENYDSVMSRGKVKKGEVLFTTEAPLGEVANIDKEDIALAQRIIKFCGNKNKLNNYYLKFFIMSFHFQSSLKMFSSGSTAQGIKAERLGYLKKILPPVNEQENIVKFLDHETGKIDKLIEKQEQLIELLKEKRQAVISHAVTKGLNPDVPMKDSGVEWLGEIPAHWEVKKLKYIGTTIIGLTYSPDNIVDKEEGVLVLRSSNVQNGKLAFYDNVYVDKEIPSKLLTKKGDILLCSRNGSRALIGKNAQIDNSSINFTFGAFMTIFRSRYNNYISKVFNSTIFDYQAGSFLTSTVNQLTTGNLQNLEIPFPPIEEQKLIKTDLDNRVEKINNLLKYQEKQIELLRERRTSLISAAVTGKIKISNRKNK